MLRVVLVAYLTFTVVLGPGLCCCSAQLLIPGAEGGCCGDHKADLSAHEGHAHHHHHHGEAEHSSPQNTKVAEGSKPSPCEHNQQDCPCGRHQQTLSNSQSADTATIRALETQGLNIWALVVDTLSLDSSRPDLNLLLSNGHFGSRALSGREILRAYSVLRI